MYNLETLKNVLSLNTTNSLMLNVTTQGQKVTNYHSYESLNVKLCLLYFGRKKQKFKHVLYSLATSLPRQKCFGGDHDYFLIEVIIFYFRYLLVEWLKLSKLTLLQKMELYISLTR